MVCGADRVCAGSFPVLLAEVSSARNTPGPFTDDDAVRGLLDYLPTYLPGVV